MVPTDPDELLLARRLTRRQLIKLAALGAVGSTLGFATACSQQTPSATSPTQPAAAAAPPKLQPTRGGKLTVLQSADIVPQNLPFLTSIPAFWIQAGVWDTLMHYRTDRLEPEMDLAESYQFSPDYKSLTLKLRDGVKFHSGRPLTSEDVKWNVEQVRDPKMASQLLNFAKWVQQIETPDPLTVIFRLDKPHRSFLDVFETLFIADRETAGERKEGKKFVGTGPYTFKEWQPGDHFTLERNPNYWQKDKPYLDEITVKILPDTQAALLNMQTGAADVAMDLEPRDKQTLRNDKNYKVITYPVMTWTWYMGIDVTVPPFNDKRVRQAMSYLLDRKRMVETQYFFGDPVVLPWDPTSPAYTPDLNSRYDYNPAKAKELLQQAGVGADQNVTLTVSLSYPETVGVAELFQAELTKLGWKASIEKLQPAQYTPKFNTGKMGGPWFTLVGYVHMDPSTLLTLAFPYRVPNPSNFDTPEYRKIISDTLDVVDAEEAKKLYRRLNELLLDESFVVPIASAQRPVVTTSKVQDLHPNRSGFPFVYDVWKTS